MNLNLRKALKNAGPPINLNEGSVSRLWWSRLQGVPKKTVTKKFKQIRVLEEPDMT